MRGTTPAIRAAVIRATVVWAAALGGLYGPASADLCPKCRNGVYIQSLGKCQWCGAATGSGAFKICPKCSAQRGLCEHCLARLDGPKRTAEARKPRRPPPIQPGKPGTYTAGRWQYRLEIAAAGKQAKRGRLLFDEIELTQPKPNDYVLTPWGPAVWLGLDKRRQRRGWMFVPIPTAKGKAKLLPTPGGKARTVGLTRADSGRTVEVAIETVVVVCLAGNPPTGYRWQVAALGSGAVKQLEREEYFARPRPPGWAGGGGTFVFKFRAVRPGKAGLKLEYVRPWEKGKAPAKTFSATVQVRPRE